MDVSLPEGTLTVRSLCVRIVGENQWNAVRPFVFIFRLGAHPRKAPTDLSLT